ncbi:hypothetical protein [Arthrobacter sp. lap29]|nr:hypothetical protein [Arthrobacter sp. lap29]
MGATTNVVPKRVFGVGRLMDCIGAQDRLDRGEVAVATSCMD